MPMKFCQQCSVSFYAKPCHITRAKYCSCACRKIAKHQEFKRICKNCGIIFFVTKARLQHQNDGTYCSRTCQRIIFDTATLSPCDQCGKLIHLKPSRRKRSRNIFCSTACQHLARQRPYQTYLWTKIQRCPHDKACPYCCWEWTGPSRGGYGYYCRGISRKSYKVHRLIWELWNNRHISAGLVCAHYCHNPKCCNPLHLHVCTQKENMQDSIRDKRMHWQKPKPTDIL